MSKPLFRSGGPLNIRRVSRDRYMANITLSTDEDGLLARSCSDSECAPGYFKVKPGTGITSPQELAYCPYCAKPAPPNDFATKAQIEYGKALMLEEAKDGVSRLVKDTFGLDSGGRRKLAGGFISMEMRFEPMPKRHVHRPVEEELRRDITCPHCGLVHAVFGLAFSCPDCGKDIFLTHVREELQVVAKILSAVPQRRAALGARVAARDVENALEDVVSIFETTMKLVTRRVLLQRGKTSEAVAEILRAKVRSKFQSVRLAAELYGEVIGGDLFACLSDVEKNALEQTLEKRHPITHNLGVVDRKYLERAASNAAEGSEVRVTPEEILAAVGLVERVVSAAYPSGGSIEPMVADDEVRWAHAAQNTTRLAALSPAALAVAQCLVKQSESGLAPDPVVDVEKLLEALSIGTEELRMALAELEKLGWLRVDPFIGGERVSPSDELFQSCDREWMGWDVREDGMTVAKLAATTDDGLTVPELAAQLGWSPRRMNPALQYVIAREGVEGSECSSHPFLTHWIRRNEKTAAFLTGEC
jgi:hypothetical protein